MHQIQTTVYSFKICKEYRSLVVAGSILQQDDQYRNLLLRYTDMFNPVL